VLAGTVLAAGLLWLLWPGQETPLSTLLRRDVTWQAMQARGTWRVGMDPSFPPFEVLDANGVPVGYDVALAQELATRWGLEAEIVAIGFDSLLDALQAAKIDAVISAYPFDPRLTRDVSFSQPYFDAGLQLAVAQGSPIGSTADLAGKRVGVEWGSEGDMVGRQLQRDGSTLTLVQFETPQATVDALLKNDESDGNDGIDAALVDSITLRQAQALGAEIEAAGPHVTSNPYVIVVPRRAFDLLAQTNQGLERLRAAGRLESLADEWFKQSPTEAVSENSQ
jgi:ABC-type amino acid transport substrate-binding protein